MTREHRFTAEEKQKCAEREWKMRMRYYPQWIEGGIMTPSAAHQELALMASIAADYRELAAKERLI